MELKSPDGRLAVSFDIKAMGGSKNPCYRMDYESRPVIVESRLGLDLEGPPWQDSLSVTDAKRSSHDATWKPVCGERAEIRDHYNQVVITLKESQPPQRALQITFRAYNEGIAFCYTIPKSAGTENVRIRREFTEFRFKENYSAWATYAGQGDYQKVPLSAIKPGCERPLVVELADDLCVALAEAKLVDYARMKFAPLTGVSNSLAAKLDGEVTNSLPLTNPWRVVMAAAGPGRLLENNFLLLNLNDPCQIADTSWIKPGKVIREVTLTTTGGKACVDFAVQRGLEYVEFDAGWYGHEYDPQANATAVNVDPKRSKGPLDLHEVIRYAGERGIGIILYVNHLALEKQLDDLLPLYKKWGVKGIKFGFVNVGSQKWTSWLHEAIRKCATNGFMVDVHDEYRPTGYSRTYPNLMTVEGIRGDETRPANRTTLAYAFTRLLAGPADNTVCYYDRRVDDNASHAYQLAKPVCLFSPWQFLFWYDRPPASPQKVGGAGNAETSIGNEPELEFFNALPTTWDEIRVIHGRIGEFAVIARRKGPRWFIGAMNTDTPRTFNVPLDFLAPGKTYTAHVYSDDPSLETRTKVRIERHQLASNYIFPMPLPAKGGMAVRLEPD